MIEKVILGFGSNAGNRLRYLDSAVKKLAMDRNFDLISLSSVYETEPWGYSKQRSFLNCCGVFLCRLDPAELIRILQETEISLGRLKRGKWMQREIDIDVLFFGKKVINNKGIRIPHPLISSRNFVLIPLQELEPGFVHPEFDRSIGELISDSINESGVKLFKSRN